MRDALAALDRLVAELRECRKAFKIGHSTLMRMQARAEAAEAERDEARRIALSLGDQLTDAVDRRAAAEAANEAAKQFSYASHRQRAEAAEAERDRARESLVSQIAYRSAAEARIKELQVALDCISGSALVEAKEAAEAEVARLREALSMLRDAWNAHMATCPHHNALPDFMRPTPADVQSWIDAPSNTASARAALGETT